MRTFNGSSTITIRSAAACILAVVLLAGCGSSYPAPGVDGKKYQYHYLLVEPSTSPKLEFKDRFLSFAFTIDDAAISYTVLNLTQDLLEVGSAGASIGIDSQFTPVRNIQSLYSDSVYGFAPVLVGPRGYFQDILIPRGNIFVNEDDEWEERDLFSTLDSGTVSGKRIITKNLGKRMQLLLPVTIGERKRIYSFSFKVSAIKVVRPDAVPEKKQRPPAPPL